MIMYSRASIIRSVCKLQQRILTMSKKKRNITCNMLADIRSIVSSLDATPTNGSFQGLEILL